MFPFTYRETLEFKKANDIPILENDFKDYLENGGMPQRYEEIDEEGIKNYLRFLYHSIIEKDVYGNHKRINKQEFENVSHYIIVKSGRIFSALGIAKYLRDDKSKEDQKKFS